MSHYLRGIDILGADLLAGGGGHHGGHGGGHIGNWPRGNVMFYPETTEYLLMVPGEDGQMQPTIARADDFIDMIVGSDAPLATAPESFMGQVVGKGQCVNFVRESVLSLPATGDWKQGAKVKGNFLIAAGTPIATFQDGEYKNRTNGDSHAAIYLSQDSSGIQVIDQWKGQPVHQRTIRFQGGGALAVNDGDAYSVVQV